MKKYGFLLLILLTRSTLHACPSCNKELNEGIYNDTFYSNLFVTLSAFFVLAIILIVLIILASRNYKALIKANPDTKNITPVPLVSASMILGIGMGGFIDGIVLHQILQWHEMLSNKIPASDFIGKSINMYWDGIFHAFCFVVVFIGITLLWKLLSRENIDRSGKLFSGGLLAGWGLFNTVESIINHHILKLHNVQEVSLHQDLGNYIFLIVSLLMILSGYVLIKKEQ